MIAFVKIIRPFNVLITFLVVVVAILITQKTKTDLNIILLASFAAALTSAGGNIINDIYDVETDRISHPERVLVKKLITKKQAVYYYNFLNTIAIVIASRISVIITILVVVSILFLFVYSAYLKRLPLIGNVVVALLTALAFVYGGFVTGNSCASFIPAVFAFLINLIRELVKDIQDVKGDNKINCKTFPIIYGLEKTRHLIAVLSMVLILFTIYPFIAQLYSIEYFAIVMIIVNPVMVYSLKLLYDREQDRTQLISKILKLNIVVGLIAIFISK